MADPNKRATIPDSMLEGWTGEARELIRRYGSVGVSATTIHVPRWVLNQVRRLGAGRADPARLEGADG